MSNNNRFALITSALLALAANACSTGAVRPVAMAAAPVECAGGTIRTEDDAARYTDCDAVIGDLRITGTNLTDLSSLKHLRSVSGAVVITDNVKLISLAGLKGLERAHSVEISNNPLLCAHFGLLPQLKQVAAPVVLNANHGLSNRDVREMLERVGMVSTQADANDAGREASLR